MKKLHIMIVLVLLNGLLKGMEELLPYPYDLRTLEGLLACPEKKKQLMLQINVGDPNCNGATLLNKVVSYRAVIPNSYDIASLLLAHEADPNCADAYGNRPLHAVCWYGSSSQQPRHLTIRFVQLLLNGGALTGVRNKWGKVPADYTQDSEVHDLLRWHVVKFIYRKVLRPINRSRVHDEGKEEQLIKLAGEMIEEIINYAYPNPQSVRPQNKTAGLIEDTAMNDEKSDELLPDCVWCARNLSPFVESR
jgi:hypothetical protein